MSRKLFGSHWQNKVVNALFVIKVLTSLVLLSCLTAVARFKWTKSDSHIHDRRKSIAYITATVAALLNLTISLVNTGLAETSATVSNNYNILFIFSSLGCRASEIVILFLVLALTLERAPSVSLAGILLVYGAIVALLLSVMTFILHAAYVARILPGNNRAGYLFWRYTSLDLTYESLYVLVCLGAVAVAGLTLMKEHSTASILLSAMIVPSLILRTLMHAVSGGLGASNLSYHTLINFWNVSSFIYCFATMAIFLGVAAVAMQRTDREVSGKNSKDHIQMDMSDSSDAGLAY